MLNHLLWRAKLGPFSAGFSARRARFSSAGRKGPESALRADPRTMSGEASDAEIQEFLARAGARDNRKEEPRQQGQRR